MESGELAEGLETAASRPPTVCMVTVDPSGDAMGAALAQALRARGPIRLYGAGGRGMREAGVELLAETTQLSSMGVVGWINSFPQAAGTNLRLRREIAALGPDLLVLIDCGAFNVPMTRTIKRRRPTQKVLYYVPPRSWSRHWRVGKLAGIADYIAAPFPWNTEGDDGTGRVRFVGHPAADVLATLPERSEARQQLGLDPEGLTLGMLPGSRPLEIRVHLPILLRAARLLRAEFPALHFVLSCARSVSRGQLERVVADSGVEGIRIAEGAGMPLRAADVALVCLGSATLESTALGCPMVTFYRGTRLQGLEYMIKPPRTRYKALPNIIAGEGIVTEVLQWDVTSERLAQEASGLLRDPAARRHATERLARVSQQLGGRGAIDRAAEAVLDALNGRWHARPRPADGPAARKPEEGLGGGA